MEADLGKWVTNAKKEDVGVKGFTLGLLEGAPKESREFSVAVLEANGYVGLYEKRAPAEGG